MRMGQARFEVRSDAVVSDPLFFARCEVAQEDQQEPIKHEEGEKQKFCDNVGFSSVHHDPRIVNASQSPPIGTVWLEVS